MHSRAKFRKIIKNILTGGDYIEYYSIFYHYGRKKQIAKYYPFPNCAAIIEPFAGAAAYSLYGDNLEEKGYID
jgi:hypothetical protein